MNVDFTDLDSGYEQCKELYETATRDGERLLENLRRVYNGLNAHWKGTDATLHINKIAEVYNAVNTFIADTCNAVSFAADGIINVQEVRRANGSTGMVGEKLAIVSEKERLNNVEETNEYSCTPEARNDFSLLCEVCEKFVGFAAEVDNEMDALLNNWKEGSERDKVVTNYQNFESSYEDYKNSLEETRSALDTAVQNISQLM